MVDQKAVNQQLKRLQEEIKNDNDEQVLKISQGLLEKIPADEDVMLSNVISHLKLGKFDSLGNFFDKQFKQGKNDDLNFSYAYYLYKKNKYDECADFIKKISGSASKNFQEPLQLLYSQVKYKKGEYLETAKILFKVVEGSDYNDNTGMILSNLLNTLSLVPPSEQKLLEESLKIASAFAQKFDETISAEFFFNLSLLYTNVGNLTYAKNYLSKFKKLIPDSNSEDFDKTDILKYDLQHDYINSYVEYTSEENEAKLKEYVERLEWDIQDYYKIALKNNLVHFRDRSKELADSLKKLDEVIKFAEGSSDFNKTQILDLKINKLILYLGKSKYAESSKLVEDLEKQHSPEEYLSNDRFVSSKFYLLFKMKKYKEIETLHQQLFEKVQHLNTNSQLPVLLLNAEINRLFGNQKALVENLQRLIETDKSLINNPTLCCVIIHTVSNNLAILPEFKDLIQLIKNQTKSSQVLAILAELALKQKEYDNAIALYEKVVKSEPNNVKALERLSFLYSFSDWKKAEEYLSRIPNVDIITEPDQLRRLELDYLPSKGKEETKVSEGIIKKIKKVKKRKPRYPKGFDPANPGSGPDPERWLPKLERTKYKKLAKKKGLLRGTQGAAAGQETVQTFQKGPSTANTEAATGGSGKKKANKKGKK